MRGLFNDLKSLSKLDNGVFVSHDMVVFFGGWGTGVSIGTDKELPWRNDTASSSESPNSWGKDRGLRSGGGGDGESSADADLK